MEIDQIILIGNYPLDRQESMTKYATNLHHGLISENIPVKLWKPPVFFAKGRISTTTGLSKWLGYLDKWIIFPTLLKLRLLKPKYRRKNVFFHVCDHSNAPYLASLPASRSGITCHDVLAIRGALGFADAYCPASKTGIILQKWILKNLTHAKRLASVSQFTMNQLTTLAVNGHRQSEKKWKVVHNSFNAPFKPMDKAECLPFLERCKISPDQSYILHVGSSLPRKNRKMVVDMIDAIDTRWDGFICFAGQPIDQALASHIEKLGLKDRVISVVKPDHQMLVALYSACEAFVFPSFSEGFGWPLIEAQACGAPVIASNIEPMPEISNGTALHADPYNKDAFADAFLQLLQPTVRERMIQQGFENCKRFDNKLLIKKFINLYQE
ncbi:glycosyltransferase family 4 protein [Parapedobacter tibetensis]|uniref:glycosyltransferase family 4 protein n=1 Tax=Parapedobacter tibetensis TaxID=2972951 RepID=UPI00214DAB08|nr:glycosyltransferase family 1 protein [Parapedobacter tibetensis]